MAFLKKATVVYFTNVKLDLQKDMCRMKHQPSFYFPHKKNHRSIFLKSGQLKD
jgi:hypothetical protein